MQVAEFLMALPLGSWVADIGTQFATSIVAFSVYVSFLKTEER